MSKLRRYIKGEVIAQEGERAKGLFILVEGRIGIYKDERKITEFTKEGTVVGEMSLILKSPRSATIKAIEDSTLLAVEGDIETITRQYPEISKKIIHSLAERLSKITSEFH